MDMLQDSQQKIPALKLSNFNKKEYLQDFWKKKSMFFEPYGDLFST